jgi:hypothetical protein
VIPQVKFEIDEEYYIELTFWRRIFFILAHPVNKMWIIQEQNTLELWNKLHFEENKRRVYIMFKIFSTYICWKYVWNVTLEVSDAVRNLLVSLGVKELDLS